MAIYPIAYNDSVGFEQRVFFFSYVENIHNGEKTKVRSVLKYWKIVLLVPYLLKIKHTLKCVSLTSSCLPFNYLEKEKKIIRSNCDTFLQAANMQKLIKTCHHKISYYIGNLNMLLLDKYIIAYRSLLVFIYHF